jgi:hypothetical protein
MRATVVIEAECRQVPAEHTSRGKPGKVHLVLNGKALHAEPNTWPWDHPTVRVPAQAFLDYPCGDCLKSLNQGLKAHTEVT